MSLFGKNPNETAYVGGKKHWTDVIKNSGDGNLLIWRQPEEDFNTNSTLVVMPGEEAIFINQGVIEQVFENGTYKLSTSNYPFISRLRNAFSGGISVFNCVVYFVRKASSVEIKWGTDSPIQVRDKVLGIATKLRARGSYKIQIENSAKFLETIIGNNIQCATQDDINKFFISQFQSKIKSAVAKELGASETEVLGIDARLEEFSEMIQPKVDELLQVNGLKCLAFSIAAIDIVLKAMASNPGNVAGQVGAGLGMGVAAANAFGTMANQMFNPNIAPTMTSGQTDQNKNADDPMEKLAKLKKMLDAGLIEQSEYDAKKSEILSSM